MNPLRTETSLFVAWTNICAWSSICALPWIVPPFPISPFNYWESEKEYPFCKTVRFLKTKDSFMYTHLSGRVGFGSGQIETWCVFVSPNQARPNHQVGFFCPNLTMPDPTHGWVKPDFSHTNFGSGRVSGQKNLACTQPEFCVGSKISA